MKQRLLFFSAFSFALILPASAQYTNHSPMSTGSPATVSMGNPSADAGAEDPTRAVSCTDKVTYVDRYTAGASAPLGSTDGFDVVLQTFPDYVGQVTKVDFSGSAFTSGTKTVTVIVYNSSTLAILATGTANVSGTTSANYSVTFATPANVTAAAGGFKVGIWPPAGDSVKVQGNTDGDALALVDAQVGSTVYNFYSDFGYDIDLLIRPTIKFTHPLTATLDITSPTVCVGNSVSFDGNYTGTSPDFFFSDMFQPDGLTYDTDYGDGSAHGSNMFSTHAYAAAGAKTGSFKVVYQGWTSNCPSDPATDNVTVNPSASAFFSWSATNLAVTFTNLSTSATTYSWAFGDAGTASAPSPIHNYGVSGTYTVELTANGTCGSDMYFTNITITDSTSGGSIGIVEAENGLLTNIYPNPASNNVTVDLSLNQAENVSLQVIGALGQVIYSRELGSIRSSLQNIDLSAHEAGVYFIRIVHDNIVSSRTFIKK